MSQSIGSTILTIFLLVLLCSCQRELSFEEGQTAKGSLTSSVTGDCLPKNVAGTYIAGNDLADTNFIEVALNVTRAGAYTIATNSVNGYSFTTTGTFSDTGNYVIKLPGKGTPAVAGTDVFSVMFDSSSCTIQVPVQSPPDTTTKPATLTLQGAPDTCMNAVIYGAYVRGASLDTSNRVAVMVNVTRPGTYSVATNTVNGFSFAATGVFTDTGSQIINLVATGSALLSGASVFTVTAGGSTCTFRLTVTEGVATTNADHFPITTGSFWSYDDLYSPTDSLRRSVIDSVVENGKRYKVTAEETRYRNPQQYLFRKEDNNYYEYGLVDKYTNTVVFQPQIKKEILFLKEGLSTGATWLSDEYIGPSSFGQTIFIQYAFTCVNANASVTINGKAFTGVYKISMRTKIRSEFADYSDAGEQRDIYYAKGVGIVYTKFTIQNFLKSEWQLRDWMVN